MSKKLTISNKNLVLDFQKTAELQKQELGKKVNQFIAVYCSAYKSKYNSWPEEIRDPKKIGRIKSYLKNSNLERACQLVQVYFQMKDPYFEKRYFDIETFLYNLNKIGVALSTGKDPDLKNDPFSFLYDDSGGDCA